ncbi:MAG: hypothetical protein HY648_02900, partial [Acidobacteria bacterium]|nr:hypothetical protein [Acidobacteriota bacterium]
MKVRGRGVLLVLLVILLGALLGGVYGPRVTAQSSSGDAEIQQSLRSISKVLRTVEQQ